MVQTTHQISLDITVWVNSPSLPWLQTKSFKTAALQALSRPGAWLELGIWSISQLLVYTYWLNTINTVYIYIYVVISQPVNYY